MQQECDPSLSVALRSLGWAANEAQQDDEACEKGNTYLTTLVFRSCLQAATSYGQSAMPA